MLTIVDQLLLSFSNSPQQKEEEEEHNYRIILKK